MKMKLNLGCGNRKLPGYVNIDWNDEGDVKFDLNEPLPYEDNSTKRYPLPSFLHSDINAGVRAWKKSEN